MEPPEYDPATSGSMQLTEVRTVLSRARTALELIEKNPDWNYHSEYVDGVWVRRTVPHPEVDDMIKSLRDTVVSLSRWERKGKRR